MMQNLKVAEILEKIADVLELKGVAYKPRAYRKAARSVRNLSQDIEEIAEKGNLQEISGVGESIAKKISEIIETGSLEYYEKLKEDFEMDYDALLSVEGLGPKRLKTLHEELGINTLEDLEEAINAHQIRELEGFGKKSEQNLRRHLEFAKKEQQRMLLAYALPLAENLKKKIEERKEVHEVVIAGSIRRKKPTIGDIDLLGITDTPDTIMRVFTSMENVSEVVAKGSTKSTIRLEEDIEADLRLLEAESFGAGLLYFTGSKALNIELRKIAKAKGWKLNEYGLFEDDTRIAGKTEEDIFTELDMAFIPPELRENRGEIDAALNHRVPQLLPYDALRGDLQMHTTWSDGSSSIEGMAKAAREFGHEYIAITDHTGTLKIAGGLSPEELRKQMQQIEAVDERLEEIRILKGAEVNIDSQGNLDMPNEILNELDIVVASIHSGFKQSEKQLTDRIVTAMENEHVNIIAHPTGRQLQKREGYELNLEKIFATSKETNTFLEINSYPNRLDLRDVHVRKAIDAGCQIAINTDAHTTEQLRFIELGIATARRGWASKEDVINTLPLSQLMDVIRK